MLTEDRVLITGVDSLMTNRNCPVRISIVFYCRSQWAIGGNLTFYSKNNSFKYCILTFIYCTCQASRPFASISQPRRPTSSWRELCADVDSILDCAITLLELISANLAWDFERIHIRSSRRYIKADQSSFPLIRGRIEFSDRSRRLGGSWPRNTVDGTSVRTHDQAGNHKTIIRCSRIRCE